MSQSDRHSVALERLTCGVPSGVKSDMLSTLGEETGGLIHLSGALPASIAT